MGTAVLMDEAGAEGSPVPVEARPWTVAPRGPRVLFDALDDVHPVVVQVLYTRGLTTAPAIRAFLAEQTLYDPQTMHGMDRAVARIEQAIARSEKIAAHGDYDVDGVTATAVLTEGLRAAGAAVLPYVPERGAAGYGVHPQTIEALAAQGVRLLITGDTGVRAQPAVARAAALGMDVIVTDHHLPGDELPAAHAVVNPHQLACPYPFKELSGCGVAWKLIQALEQRGRLGGYRAITLLDLVAMGTIVDVMPLVGENRRLVQLGLELLRESPRPGIQALMARTNKGKPVTEQTIGFVWGPRLNAAGRMDSARLAYDLLMAPDVATAEALVERLETLNQERRVATEQVLVEARAQAERSLDAGTRLLMVRGEGWRVGVLGLVANRLADQYRLPTIVLDVGPEVCRGSGRSIAGLDLMAALTACDDLLEDFGGHVQAAGFAVQRAHLDALEARLAEVCAGWERVDQAPIVADAALKETTVDWRLYHGLSALRPFGHGNQAPLLLTRNLSVRELRTVGTEGQHLRARLRCGRQTLTAFGPNLGPQVRSLSGTGQVDVLYTLESNPWNGRDYLELQLQAIRPSGGPYAEASA